MKNIFFLFLLCCTACINNATEQNKTSTNSSATDIFKTYYKDLSIPKMKDIEHYNSDYYLALLHKDLKFYEEKKYEEAVRGITNTAKGTPQQAQPIIRTYWGLCYLNMDMDREALVKFNEVDPNSPYGQKALWYKALTYLKMGNVDGARSDLSKIAGVKGHYQQAEAKEILKQL